MQRTIKIKTGFNSLKELTIEDVRKLTRQQGIDPDKASDNMLRYIHNKRK